MIHQIRAVAADLGLASPSPAMREIVRITAFVKGLIERLRTPLDAATTIFVEGSA